MKILLINSLYTATVVGGAELFVRALAESLAEAGHEAVVASTTPKDAHTERVGGVKIRYVRLKNLHWPFAEEDGHPALKPLAHAIDTYNPLMAREAARIMDAERPDIVHTHNLSGFSVAAWRRAKQRGLPLIHTLHDHYLLCPRGTMFRGGVNCERRCAECFPYALPRGHASRQVDAVVGVSRFILERHLHFGHFGGAAEKRVIPNSYEVRPLALPPNAWPSPIRLGYLGHLSYRKGVELLIESAARLPENTWRLKVAGRGLAAYERDLRSRYTAPNIEFVGRAEPESFFPEVDVLVAPSLLCESFGRTVIEAYAHGVPVIGSDRGGIAELVEDGRTGFLFDPGRPGDLAAKMRRFIEKPSLIEGMRQRCLEKAKDYLPKNVVDEYLDLYAAAESVRRGS